MSRPRIWILYLAGPPVPGTSAHRALSIRSDWGGRLVGLGLGLHRLRFLDRLLPLCLAGWRRVPLPEGPESACHVLPAGQRLILGRRRAPQKADDAP